ncbi:MAG: isoprenyl transferase [Saprospiraceae bacterium]|nr:isoprenyl transferase [Bacteroidia bacterium]MBT8230782.1 isoprenyl transferase [Bacteroidia bacterium]NNF22740.1 isoprenyl transferase [Saprospiraceae bacterium]NNK89565.1 isoprenyl transferase [Saprospiraceae bacterium]
MLDLKSKIDLKNIPVHIAVIMDGNGRWAKKHGKPRIFGHQNGVKAVREITESSAELGISYLTLYAFSTENWNRPKLEVNALMHLLIETVRKEVITLNENNIRLNAIGDLNKLPKKTYNALMDGIDQTEGNTGMTLTLALNYSSRWEITETVKTIAEEVREGRIKTEDITNGLVSSFLQTGDMPDPELMIRTSGEFRISNYLLWQMAYSEFYFTDVYWPDFRKVHLYDAIIDYQSRERRFGKISEQITT